MALNVEICVPYDADDNGGESTDIGKRLATLDRQCQWFLDATAPLSVIVVTSTFRATDIKRRSIVRTASATQGASIVPKEGSASLAQLIEVCAYLKDDDVATLLTVANAL